MISPAKFKAIRKKHGRYASWAIWRNETTTPKEHIGDVTVFDLKRNPNTRGTLHGSFVLVGLNISRPVDLLFGNFHDERPMANDYKIRYALRDTKLWGAYMTDMIKHFEEKASGRMMSYLRTHPKFLKRNIRRFLNEIELLGSTNPVLIAFGRDTQKILKKHLGSKFRICGVPHYAIRMSKEKYRTVVHTALREHL